MANDKSGARKNAVTGSFTVRVPKNATTGTFSKSTAKTGIIRVREQSKRTK